MHIGLIGGIGPAATEFYYRGLTRAHQASQSTLQLTIAHADLRALARNLGEGAAAAQAQLYLGHARQLQAAGAQVLAIASVGGHFCIREFSALSPLPIINGVEAVRTALALRKFKRIGVLGTRTVMVSRLYGSVPDIEVVVPQGAALDAAHDLYIGMATTAAVDAQQRAAIFEIGRTLVHDQRAEVVLLGGTDLFLAFGDHDPGYPVLDCAQVHVAAILQMTRP